MAFNILRAARAVVQVTDLDAAREFYVDALGFVETECDGEHLYLRGLEEHNHHSFVLRKAAGPGVRALGYKVYSEADLETLADVFESAGMKVKWLEKGSQHAVGRALRVRDESGIPLEFFAEMETAQRLLQRYDLYRGAHMQRIDHFNCMVPDVEKAHDFYIQKLGFRCSEYTVTEDDRIWAAWLHRKPTVHDVAVMNGSGPRFHHVGFWLSDPMKVLHTCDVLASLGHGAAMERGPGRHGLSNAFFLYLRDPDGNRIELYTGDYLTLDPDFKPIRWDLDDPKRQTLWGHKAPDSWFEEATPFLDIETGEEVKLLQPVLNRRPEIVIDG